MADKIAIASDHVGYDLRQKICTFLKEKHYDVIDLGCDRKKRVDYPVYAKLVAQEVTQDEATKGILICGTGVGMSICANKVARIRAVCCSEAYSAKLSRKHNNTNVLTLGARVIGDEVAFMIVEEWLNTEFEKGRHEKRVQMISEMEGR